MKYTYSSLNLYFVLVVLGLVFGLESNAQCPTSLIQGMYVTNRTATSVQLNWQDNYNGTLSVEWGVCGFTPATGFYKTFSGSDSVVIDRLSPSLSYDVYLSCVNGQILDTLSFSMGCQFVGDDISSALPIDFDTHPWTWGTPDPLYKVRIHSVDPAGCLTDALPYQPLKDVVYKYTPKPNSEYISIQAPSAFDTASIRILDSSLNVVAVSDTCYYARGAPATIGAGLRNFSVDREMVYFIAIEIDSNLTSYGNCSAWVDFIFEEFRTACIAPDMSELDTLFTSCDAMAIQWNSHDVDTFQVCMVRAGMPPSSAATTVVTDTLFAVSNLLSNTPYDFYFRAGCSTESADWQGPYTYSTRTGASTAVANFMYTLDSLTITDAYFSFDANASVADSVMWDFGDGNQDVGFLVHHVYQMAGQVTVTALAIHNCSVDTQSVVIYIPYSISEFEAEGFQVYPQPVADFATVQIQANLVLNLNLYDVTGRLITSQLPFEDNGENIILDVRNLAPGTYVLQVETANGVSNSRIIRQ